VTADCLSAAQVAAALAYYAGPVDKDGEHLFAGGEPYGSELLWSGPAAFTRGGKFAAEAFIRDILLAGDLPADFTWRDWRFDRASFDKLMKAGELYDASDPDLRAFRDAGGKLLMWQGAADNAGGIHGMLDYYQAVRDRVGGLPAAREFARLFLVPGGYHCRGGYIPYDQDFLGAMVNWVETGKPADAVIATARLDDGTVRHRPLYAYPTATRYLRGDINAAASFAPRPVTREPDDGYDWPASRALRPAAPSVIR
jgi:feruloyl esterase